MIERIRVFQPLSFAKTVNAHEEIDFRSTLKAKCRVMLRAVFITLRFIMLSLAGHKQIALENAALRQQLAILKREQPRPKLQYRDRLFWIFLMKIWKQWRTALVIVQPATGL